MAAGRRGDAREKLCAVLAAAEAHLFRARGTIMRRDKATIRNLYSSSSSSEAVLYTYVYNINQKKNVYTLTGGAAGGRDGRAGCYTRAL